MWNTTESSGAEEEQQKLMPVYLLIPSLCCIIVMIILATGGNILIIISYWRDKHLRTVHNMYIINLAVVDFFIGIICMPFYAVYTILVWYWPFGPGVCKFFLMVDFMLCFEAVLLISVISLDRLILVVKGAAYLTKETFKVGYIKVGITWLLSFALYSPAIIGWEYWSKKNSSVEAGDCDTEFADEFHFTLATSLIDFVLPFVSISVLNILIYIKIRQRTQIFSLKKSQISNDQLNNVQGQKSPNISRVITISTEPVDQLEEPGDQRKDTNLKASEKAPRKDIKAAKALGVLVLALAVCWGPYTISTLILAVCDTCVNKSLYEFLNWLLWFKSCINPFLYAFNSNRFRMNMKKLLPCCRVNKTDRKL